MLKIYKYVINFLIFRRVYGAVLNSDLVTNQFSTEEKRRGGERTSAIKRSSRCNSRSCVRLSLC